ncbi:MAG: type II secretion system protein, partial [Acidimicrobiales bacterium]
MVPIIRQRSEEGDTLIEVLMALVVLGIASIALLVGFGTVISGSSVHRTLSNQNLALEAGAQQLAGLIQTSTSPNYLADACVNGSPTYTVANYPDYLANNGSGLLEVEGGNSYYVNYATSPYTPIQYWNGSAYASTCTSASNGFAQLITIELAGSSKVLTFVVGNPSSTSSSTSGLGNGSLKILNYSSAQGSPTAAGSAGAYLSLQPYVEVLDSSGVNASSNDLSPVVLTVTQIVGSGGALSGCSGLEVNGYVTFSECSISVAGTYSIQATDLNSNIGSSIPYYITVGAAGYHLSFTKPAATSSGACSLSGTSGEPVGGVSGAALATQPAVWVENSSNQQQCGWTGTIALASSGGNLSNDAAANSTCLSLSATNGFAQPASGGCDFAGAYTLASEGTYLATQYVLIASVPNPPSSSVAPADSNAFGVSSYGAATQLVYYLQPIGVASSSASTVFASQSVTIPFVTTSSAQAVVAVEDSFGNVVATAKNGSNTMGLSFSLTGGGTLSSCSQGTLMSGYYLISGCHGSAYSSSVTLTATSTISVTVNGTSSMPSTTSSSFGITGVPANLIFSTPPVAGASGSIFTTMPVLEVVDSSGTRVVTAATGGTLTLTASGGTLANCTNLTLVSGVVSPQNCTFAGLESTNYTLTGTITVNVGGTNYPLSATSGNFSPSLPGAATQLVFVTSPVGGAAGSVFPTQPVVYVEDSSGNLVSSSNAVITLTASGGTLANCADLAATGGVVNVAGCTFGGLVGPPTVYTLTASSSGLTSGVSGSFFVTAPGPVSQIVLNLSVSGSSCSPSIVYGATCTVTATYEDAYGNTETTDNSPIAFQNTGSNGGAVSATAPSQSNGVATETLTGTGVGTISVTATGGGYSSTQGTFSVTKAPQTVSFYTALGGGSVTTGNTVTYSNGGTYQTYAQGSQGGAITFASTTQAVCTVNATGLITIVTGGSCVITADAAATTNYADSGTTNFTLTISKANQTINFTTTNPARDRVGGPSYTPSATSTSGLTVSITLDAGSTGCALNAGTVTFTGAGTCVIDANQAGNASYNMATQVQQTIVVVNLGFASLVTAGATGTTVTTSNAYSITPVSGSKIVIFISFTSGSATGNTCGTPTSTAFTGATEIGTPYQFYGVAGGPWDYLCEYTAISNGTKAAVTETDTATAASGGPPAVTIQVMNITGDNAAVVTNSTTNNSGNVSSTTPVFNLGATPGTTSLEFAFGAAQFTNGGAAPTWTTPTNFAVLSTQSTSNTGYPPITGEIFDGPATATTNDTLSAASRWGTIGLEI